MNAPLTAEQAALKARDTVERLQLAYKRVFNGKPTREDQTLVLNDLELFCNVRTDMSAVSDGWRVHVEVGKFRVWQRINALRFPRPVGGRGDFKASVQREGGLSVQEAKDGDGPSRPGPGVAFPTAD